GARVGHSLPTRRSSDLVSVQRCIIDSGGCKVACVACVVADGRVVRGYVRSVGGNGHGTRKIDLLPAGSGFRCKGCASQKGAAAGSEVDETRPQSRADLV